MNTTEKIKCGVGAATATATVVGVHVAAIPVVGVFAAISTLGYGIYKWFNS